MQAAATPGAGTPLATTPSGAQRTQAGLAALLRMEQLKLRARPMTKVLLGIALFGSALFMSLAYLAVRLSSYGTEADRQSDIQALLMPNGLNDGTQILSLLAGILIAVLAASVAGSEFSWGTVRVLVGTGQSRVKLVVAKVLAVLQYSVAFAAAGVAGVVIASTTMGLIGGHDVSYDWLTMGFVGDFAQIFARLVFLIFVNGALAFSIALLTRSLAAGIAISIGWGVVEGIVVALLGTMGNIGDKISQGLTTPNVNAIMNHLRITDPAGSDGINELQAFGVLSLYIIIPLAIATFVFRRRDITSGA